MTAAERLSRACDWASGPFVGQCLFSGSDKLPSVSRFNLHHRETLQPCYQKMAFDQLYLLLASSNQMRELPGEHLLNWEVDMRFFRKHAVLTLCAIILPATMNVAATPAYAMKSACMLKAEEAANKVGPPYSDEWYAAYDFVYEYCQINVLQCDSFSGTTVCYHPSV